MKIHMDFALRTKMFYVIFSHVLKLNIALRTKMFYVIFSSVQSWISSLIWHENKCCSVEESDCISRHACASILFCNWTENTLKLQHKHSENTAELVLHLLTVRIPMVTGWHPIIVHIDTRKFHWLSNFKVSSQKKYGHVVSLSTHWIVHLKKKLN